MLIKIIKEIKYWFWLCVILAWDLMFCDIGNRQALWDQEYADWEYNLNPSEGSGWINSIVRP